MKIGPFKGQNVPWRSQNWWISKKFLNKRLMYLNNLLDLSYKIFRFSLILLTSGFILALKRPKFHLSALFWIKGSYRSSSECYESIFGSITFCICNLAFPATLEAFLAFMALKLISYKLTALLTPIKPKTTKKIMILTFLALWPLVWSLRRLLAFYIFSVILDT